MIPLVTLTEGKAHLLVVDDQSDALIDSKIKQASDIIRDYLKRWADRRALVSSSSVASPTMITTAVPHGFTAGDEVTIVGHSGSTPELAGPYVIAAVTSTVTFTVPVAVTVAGSGGSAIVAWDVDTVPAPVKAAVLLMLTHLYERRGEDMTDTDDALWAAIGRLLARSRDPAFA